MLRKAFTLAEILITLAIIGVVAALTIKAVQNASWDMQQKAQFKKVISTIGNALDGIRADLGYFPDCRYGLPAGSATDDCTFFWAEFKKKLNIIKTCTSNAYSGGCIPYYPEGYTQTCPNFSQVNIQNALPAYVLSDGAIIMNYSLNHPLMLVDINGKTPPNKMGYDVFEMRFHGNNTYTKISSYNCIDPPEPGGMTSRQMFAAISQ